MVKYYYFDMLKKFREGIPDNDTLYPCIARMEESIAYKNNPTFRRMVTNWDGASSYLQSTTNRNGMLYQYYTSEEMEQMIIEPTNSDIDPSLKLLAKRKRR